MLSEETTTCMTGDPLNKEIGCGLMFFFGVIGAQLILFEGPVEFKALCAIMFVVGTYLWIRYRG
jgi:hypothetical protein